MQKTFCSVINWYANNLAIITLMNSSVTKGISQDFCGDTVNLEKDTTVTVVLSMFIVDIYQAQKRFYCESNL